MTLLNLHKAKLFSFHKKLMYDLMFQHYINIYGYPYCLRHIYNEDGTVGRAYLQWKNGLTYSVSHLGCEPVIKIYYES
jgi:hypothetical protein